MSDAQIVTSSSATSALFEPCEDCGRLIQIKMCSDKV